MEQHARLQKQPGSIRPDEYNWRCHVLPALGTKKVAAVTRADIAHLHHAMRATPGAANRVLARIALEHVDGYRTAFGITQESKDHLSLTLCAVARRPKLGQCTGMALAVGGREIVESQSAFAQVTGG
jgi:hypothetical protein